MIPQLHRTSGVNEAETGPPKQLAGPSREGDGS